MSVPPASLPPNTVVQPNNNVPPAQPADSSDPPAPRQSTTRNYAPRSFTATATSSTTGLDPLVRIAETYVAQFDINNTLPSTYVPNARHFFQVIDQMDLLMSTTRRFYDSTHLWHPVVSKLIFGIYYIIQTMKAQATNSQADLYTTNFLDWFDKTFPLSQLLIPGPLKPFFTSLSCFSAPHANYGNISPTMPRTCSANAASSFFLQHGHSYLLPPIPFLMDQLQVFTDDTLTPAEPSTAQPLSFLADFNRRDLNIHGTDNVNAANTALTSVPCINTNFAAPAHIEIQFYRARNILRNAMPARLLVADNQASMTWPDFLGLTRNNQAYTHQWFALLTPIMNKYSQHFKGSVPFSTITTVGQGPSICVFTPLQNALNRSAYNDFSAYHPAIPEAVPPTQPPTYRPPTIRQSHVRNHTVQATHSDHELPDVSAQYAAVTVLNIDLSDLAPVEDQPALPTNAVTRFGPAWSVTPIRQLNPADVTQSIAANIALHYHVDTRMT